MQKTRLKSDYCHGIGVPRIDVAAEVALKASASLQLLWYLQAAIRTHSGRACALNPTGAGHGNSKLAKMETEWQIS